MNDSYKERVAKEKDKIWEEAMDKFAESEFITRLQMTEAIKLYSENRMISELNLRQHIHIIAEFQHLILKVRRTLDSYSKQTTGLRRFITRQSQVSKDGIEILSSFLEKWNVKNRDDYEDLQALIEYLLGHQKSLPTRFDLAGKQPSPLKEGSRLRGLLDQHYQEFLVDREKMKTSDNIKFVWAP